MAFTDEAAHYDINYKKIWRMIWPSMRRKWKLFPFLFLGAVVIAVLNVVEPYIYGRIIDLILASVDSGVTSSEAFQELAPFLGIWVGLVVIITLTQITHSYTTWWVGNKSLGYFLAELFQRALKLSVRRFEDEKSGQILRRFNQSWDAIFELLSSLVRDVQTAAYTFILVTVVGLFLDWRMTLIALIPVPLIALVGWINYRIARPKQDKVNQEYENISGSVGDAFTNIATVKSFGREEQILNSVQKDYWRVNIVQNRVNYIWTIAEGGYGAVFTAGRLLIFAAGAWFVLEGTLSLGTMLMFLGFVGFLFRSTMRIVSSLPMMLRYFSRLDRTEKIWNEQPTIVEKEDAKDLKKAKGEVAFDDVIFSYDEGRDVLRKIAFTIPAGETWALVGESGAGKSTLAKLMLRFEDPTSGAIKIDGNDLRDLTLASVRKNVGLVMQENLLFHDTIINNIRLAKPKATEKEVKAAVKRAQAAGFIEKLPDGYKSTVGERGVKLSGGEKQRIALARVFLENPPILVLDEATSALDSKTEHDLQLALQEVMKDRTTIVIAHRLSTVMAADNILVMDKGKIVDQGTHEELIKRGGLYQNYWQIQAGGYV